MKTQQIAHCVASLSSVDFQGQSAVKREAMVMRKPWILTCAPLMGSVDFGDSQLWWCLFGRCQ